MKKKFKLNKEMVFLIIVILVVIISGTIAWFTWSSKKSDLVLTIGDEDGTLITLTPYQLTGSLKSVVSYLDSNVNYVQVTANNSSSTNASLIGLEYKINSIDSELISSDVKYAITKSDSLNSGYTEYLTGNFSTASVGDALEIMSDETIAANSTKYYRVYLYIDGSSSDTSTLMNKSLNVELDANI